MPLKTTLKSRLLDETDKKILSILQDNGRESLTNISKKVGLSIDAVNRRIEEMQRKKIFSFGIYLDPASLGFPLICESKIKLKNIKIGEKNGFINYLTAHPHVIELFSTLGDFDMTCVTIAVDTNGLERELTEIRQKYANIISEWTSVLVLKEHKFERYTFT